MKNLKKVFTCVGIFGLDVYFVINDKRKKCVHLQISCKQTVEVGMRGLETKPSSFESIHFRYTVSGPNSLKCLKLVGSYLKLFSYLN